MARRIAGIVLLFAFWLLLTMEFSPGYLIAGALLSAFVGYVTSGIFSLGYKVMDPRRWLWFLLYVPYFGFYCVKANLDVAYRVLHPDRPIRPGIVKVKTELKSDVGRTVLANSITLTPGTLTIDIVGDDLYVHWINVTTKDVEEETEAIVKRFEGLLKRIFE